MTVTCLRFLRFSIAMRGFCFSGARNVLGNGGHSQFAVKLNKGWTPVLIKVSRAGTPWGFALRFLDADGKPVDDLRYDPEAKR